MPPRKPIKSTAESINAMRSYTSQKEHMASMEQRLTMLVQWHEDLGNNVLDLGEGVRDLTGRVKTLEQSFTEVRQDLTDLSTQLRDAAATSQQVLRDISVCLAGSKIPGMERPGLVDDVKQLSTGIKEVRDIASANNERLSSLERTRASLIWAGGSLSTVVCSALFYVWTHTDQLLTAITTIYGKPKTEVAAPASTTK